MFTKGFDKYVCEGDSITCEVGRFTATATIYRDECGDKPDERDEGFWPSQDPQAAGYIGPKSQAEFAAEQAKMQRIMDAWLNDEWFYCGVDVTIECEGVQLTGQYQNALWGIECNWPDSDNDYLREVANELLGEAIAQAEAKIAALAAA